MKEHEWSKPITVDGLRDLRAFKCHGCEAVRFNEPSTDHDLTKVPADCDVAKRMVIDGAFRWDYDRVKPTFEWPDACVAATRT